MAGNLLYNVQHNIELEVHDCPTCGMPYAAPTSFFSRIKARKEKNNWYCPRGHPIVFADSEITKLQKQIEAERLGAEMERRMREKAQQERDRAKLQARAQKAAKTRFKNRIAAGACPCCNRTFTNLQRHMTDMHPDFTKKDE